MNASIIISVAGLMITFATIAVRCGSLKKTVDVHEKTLTDCVTKDQITQITDRMKEDREHNNRRFEELYNSRNELRVSVERIEKSLEAILRELKEDIKANINSLEKKIDRLYERREYDKG
jgi:chromosome segregation ATPase